MSEQQFQFPINNRWTLEEVKKLNNPDYLEAYRKFYVETSSNWRNYDRPLKELMEMFTLQYTTNFFVFLEQSQDPATLNGAEMFAVLLEQWLESECIKYALIHGTHTKYVQSSDEEVAE